MAGTSHSCGENVAAFALGALGASEAEQMRRHLETCAVCAEELAAFRPVVDLLAVTPPRLSAPPALRREVMRAIADEPALDSHSRRQRRRLRYGRARPRLAPALAGGLALVAVAVVAVVLALSSGSSSTRTVAARVSGRGSAALRVRHGQGELVVRGFPSPPRGKVYEVWLQHGTGAIQPTFALFGVTRSGAGDVDVPGSLHGVSHVYVSAEPDGGSPHPTQTPVIDARLG